MRCARVISAAVTLAVTVATPGLAAARYGVGELVARYIDHSRTVFLPGIGRVPRPLPTVIRYPVTPPGAVDVRGAAPAAGRFPLVVFAHGFAATPALYAALLRTWVRAGYVVAAPFFALTNAAAPGGPDESDLVNQPADMSVVITRVLAASARGHGRLRGVVNGAQIAVAGQSDGGSTALDSADDRVAPDRRVDAAIVLSGAEMPGRDSFPFPVGGPPLLAVQGTADTSNAPASTYHYFGLARPPKFLLRLFGAGHLTPYVSQPQLGIVERETLAFLDRYLTHRRGARARMWADGDAP